MTDLDRLREHYRAQRYPGDLAQDVARAGAPRPRRWPRLLAPAALAAAGLASVLLLDREPVEEPSRSAIRTALPSPPTIQVPAPARWLPSRRPSLPSRLVLPSTLAPPPERKEC